MEGSIKVNLPSVSLKIVIAVHFVLTIWGDQIGWLPGTYLFCNLLVLAVGVWAVASPENEDASQLFLGGMLFTILQDIIVIAIYYDPDHHRFVYGSHYRFCVGMAILSLILKPLSCLLIFQNHRSRGGIQDYSWTVTCPIKLECADKGNPYVTIEGHTTSHPQGYAPVPAPGNPPHS
ncbi:type-1 angiotensin II receptor-associated protein-like isoform X1 [Montipora foliosa]|uniref:type-1 angiotensin II receptor-associated protein-like isoform X1 n=1 Tax=Montipora foliosa TaxID=591990 RepID=UPI0035F1C4B7